MAQLAPFDAVDYLDDEQTIAEYLTAALEDPDWCESVIARYGDKALTSGFHVTTTIDPALQAAADAAVRTGLRVYDHRHGWNKVEKHFDLGEGETDAQIARTARDILTQAGLTDAMPPGNVSYIEPEERATLRAWFDSAGRG